MRTIKALFMIPYILVLVVLGCAWCVVDALTEYVRKKK